MKSGSLLDDVEINYDEIAKEVSQIGAENDKDEFPFLKIVEEINDLVKKGLLQVDPRNKNNILVYREKGDKNPEGWYSENIFDVASELLHDPDNYEAFKNAAREKEELEK